MRAGSKFAELVKTSAAARAVIPIVLISAALGIFWSGMYSKMFVSPAEKLGGAVASVSARVTDFPSEYDDYSTVSVKLTEPGYPRLTCLVYSKGASFGNILKPGDEIRVTLRFALPAAAENLGADKFTSRGIFLRAYQQGELEVTGVYALRLLYFPKYLAYHVSRGVFGAFPGDVSALETALLTGDTVQLYKDTELNTAMSISGIMHVVSVSGMHVSFLVGLIGSLTRGRRRATAAIAIPLICVFIPMAGAGPAVIRAGIMQICVLTAPLLKRETDPLTTLLAVLAGLLIFNPMTCAGISLQLSFGAMAGIILVTGKISKRMTDAVKTKNKALKYLLRIVISSLASTLGASVFTIPLVSVYFGYVSIISVFVNLFTMTAFSLCFSLGYLACILYYIFAPLGAVLGWTLAWLLRYVSAAAKLAARIPYAAVFTGNRIFAWWLVTAYAVVIICRFGGRGRASRRERFRWPIPASLIIVTLCCSIFLSELSLSSAAGYLTVTDVGQGEAVVFVSGKSTAVFDCGGERGGSSQVINYLMSKGRRKINLLALTHLHSDHAAGAAELIRRLDVELLCLPADAPDDDGLLDEILLAAAEKGVAVHYIASNTEVFSDTVKINVCASALKADANESGLVFTLEAGDFSALIMGDAGFPVENILIYSGMLSHSDALIVGHHGSKYSTSDEFLAEVTPRTAIISVGRNIYGHPTEETLSRLENAGAAIYRTDLNGNVEIRIK
jgi:competence protein ComEC